MSHQAQDQRAPDAEPPDSMCSSCGNRVPMGQGYAPGSGGDVLCGLRCALRYPPLVHRAARVALLVGTALTLINQGDAILELHFSTPLVLKALLTYCVPFSVAIYSAYSALSTARR